MDTMMIRYISAANEVYTDGNQDRDRSLAAEANEVTLQRVQWSGMCWNIYLNKFEQFLVEPDSSVIIDKIE
jgi:hypothetical protein